MGEELIELCKEVYKRLPKWKDTVQFLWLDDSHHITHPEWDTIETATHDMGGKGTPLYTSDYLLEKLPQFIRFDGFEMSRLEVCPAGYGKEYKTPNYTPKCPYVAEWCAGYHTKHGEIIKLGVSDTPRKALLKLVIALDDAGVKL